MKSIIGSAIPLHILEELAKQRRQRQEHGGYQPKYLELELPLPPTHPRQSAPEPPPSKDEEGQQRGVHIIELF